MRCLNCSANGIPLTMEICPNCGVYLPSLLVNTLPHGTELDRGKYRIDYVLGKGGFGITYQAVNSKLEQRIAIKEYCPAEDVVRNSKTGGFTMPNSYSEEFQRGKKKFLAEAKTLAQFTDPNIVRAIDFFEENDTAYMVMELISGQSLAQELKAAPTGKLSIPRIIEIMDVLVKVLTTVHAQGVYHLDLKPENVMVTVDRGIVLVDFGSSRQVQFGTKSMRTFDPGYAPPELMSKKGAVGTYSDVFELAMLLHTLLVGKPASSSFDRAFSPNMDPLDPSLPADWASLIRSAIVLQPLERPQSVAEWWVLAPLSSVSSQIEPASEDPATETREITLEEFAEMLAKDPTLVAELAEQFGVETTDPQVIVNAVMTQMEMQRLSTFSFETAQVKLVGGKIQITKSPGTAKYFVEDLGNGVTLDMVYVPAGRFMMGSPESEKGRRHSESPQHLVNVPAFYMSKYPVTQAQYLAIVASNPSRFKNSQRPVESVSWDDAQAFCQKLGKLKTKAYSLPSEAQWEYACRANTNTPFYFGEYISPDVVKYDGRDSYGDAPKRIYYETTTTDVGSFPPNSFGLYDLHGNVWEWCLDTWNENYQAAPTDGSAWVNENNDQLLRGGSWRDYPVSCRSSNRIRSARDYRDSCFGFRVVCALSPGFP